MSSNIPSPNASNNPNYQHRPVGAGICKRSKRRGPRKTTGRGKKQSIPSQTFKAIAANCVNDTQLDDFIAGQLTNGLQAMPLAQKLDYITALHTTYPSKHHGKLGDILKASDVEVVVALVGPPEASLNPAVVRLGGTSVYTAAERQKVIQFQVLVSSTMSARKYLLLQEDRWKNTKKQFSLPSKDYIKGPYLAVVTVEKSTGLTVRERFWPVWFHGNRLELIRSDLERQSRGVVDAFGFDCIALQRQDDLAELQKRLGTLWTGDLGKYRFLPDLVILPKNRGLVVIFELFGLRNVKRYDECARTKLKHANAIATAGHVRFIYIDAKKLNGRSIAAAMRDELAKL